MRAQFAENVRIGTGMWGEQGKSGNRQGRWESYTSRGELHAEDLIALLPDVLEQGTLLHVKKLHRPVGTRGQQNGFDSWSSGRI